MGDWTEDRPFEPWRKNKTIRESIWTIFNFPRAVVAVVLPNQTILISQKSQSPQTNHWTWKMTKSCYNSIDFTMDAIYTAMVSTKSQILLCNLLFWLKCRGLYYFNKLTKPNLTKGLPYQTPCMFGVKIYQTSS